MTDARFAHASRKDTMLEPMREMYAKYGPDPRQPAHIRRFKDTEEDGVCLVRLKFVPTFHVPGDDFSLPFALVPMHIAKSIIDISKADAPLVIEGRDLGENVTCSYAFIINACDAFAICLGLDPKKSSFTVTVASDGLTSVGTYTMPITAEGKIFCSGLCGRTDGDDSCQQIHLFRFISASRSVGHRQGKRE